MNMPKLTPFGWGLVVGCTGAAVISGESLFAFENSFLDVLSVAVSAVVGGIIGLAFAHAVTINKDDPNE